LYSAVRKGHTEFVQLLLAHLDVDVNYVTNDGASPLFVVAHSDHHKCVELLLVNNLSGLVEYFPYWRTLVTTILLCNFSLARPLPNLIWKFIFSFLRSRTNVNGTIVKSKISHEGIELGLVSGATALWAAAARGHLACVAHLLQQDGLEVNKPDTTGRTPLMAAQAGGHINCAAFLLAYEK